MDSTRRRSAFRALVQDFSPFWFTWCMNAGVLGLLLHQLPYQFHGLKIIATIFYIVDLALFIFFSTAFILRFALYRKTAYEELTSEQGELMLCGCWPIAFMTLTSLTPLICSNAYWGHAFTIVGYVMWWIVATWSLAFLFWIFTTLIRKHEASDRRVPMMIIIPAVSVSTASLTGAFVVTMSYEMTATLGVPVMLVSFMLVGIGILFGFMLCTYLFHGLLAKGWPAPAQTPSLYIFVGPFGQSAAALQLLGSAANKSMMFAQYNRGTFLTANSAETLEVACILVAILLSGLGVLFTLLSTLAMIESALRRELTWSPGWNSIIFPMGTLCTSFELFAIETDGTAFKVIVTILVLILVILFLVNLGFATSRIAAGKLLVVRNDPRVNDQEKKA